MKTCKIATIPGDGIGKEVIPAGQQVPQALAEAEGGFRFAFEASAAGAATGTARTAR